ncbi:MAG: DUF3857 domain-containing protein [Weeksellaceae bacterium]|nr:DUF3857 domain-containing protein [Weeksellaceae bacterium]
MYRLFFFVFFLGFLTPKGQVFPVSEIPAEILNDKSKSAVVRSEKTELVLLSQDRFEHQYEIVVTVFNSNADHFTSFPIHYIPSTKIKQYYGEVYDADGKIIKKLGKKDFSDYSAVDNSSLYTESRVLVGDFTPTRYPYTIKYFVSLEQSNTAFIPTWQPFSGYNIGVEKSEYIINNPRNLTYFFSLYNQDQFAVRQEKSGNKLHLAIEKIAGIDYEPMAPQASSFFPYARVALQDFNLISVKGSAKDWKEFGLWYNNNLLNDRMDIPTETKNQIKQLVANEEDVEEKVYKIYNYLQQKTRYINVALNIGGWQPYKASHVNRTGYGDCKGLSNYMKSLLDAVDIPSNLVILYADSRHKQNFDADLPAPQGNHMLLQVPTKEDTIWLECTTQQGPFNHLGQFGYDRKALVLTPEGGVIQKTQFYPKEKNITSTKINTTNLPNNKVNLILESSHFGLMYDDERRFIDMNQDDLKKQFQAQYSHLGQVYVKEINITNDKRYGNIQREVNANIDNWHQKPNPVFLVTSINPFFQNPYNYGRNNDRKLPFHIPFGSISTFQASYQIPEHHSIVEMPQNQKISTIFGSYEMSITSDDKQILIHSTIDLNQGEYSKQQYNDFIDFFKNIERVEKSKILFEKKS